MSDQKVVAGLVATVMFLVGGLVVLGAKGWIHRPAAAAVAPSSSATEVVRVSATPPTVDPVTIAPVLVASTTIATVTAPPPATTSLPRAAVRTSRDAHGDALTGSLVTSAPVANAEASLARLRPGIRSCYNAGLAADPNMTGKIVLDIKLDPKGDVQRVDKVDGSGLSTDVEGCIIRKAKNATFDAPGGNGSLLRVPFTFVRD